MNIQFRPEQEQVIDQAIQAGLIDRADEVVDVGLEALRSRLAARSTSATSRHDAVRRMQEFGETHQLSFGEPLTRNLLHEGHRY